MFVLGYALSTSICVFHWLFFGPPPHVYVAEGTRPSYPNDVFRAHVHKDWTDFMDVDVYIVFRSIFEYWQFSDPFLSTDLHIGF